MGSPIIGLPFFFSSGYKNPLSAYYLQNGQEENAVTDKTDNRDILEELSLLKDRLKKNEQLFNLAEEESVIEALVF